MSESEAPQSSLGSSLRTWFTRPPRRHGEVDHERTVSFLELFYDLVFVVLIAQIGHHLAGHVSWEGVLDFAVVFGLVWIAWLNGSMYHELHGREDGRHRNYIFIQMYLLVLLAVFAGQATDDEGQAFALTYAVLLAVLTWQWYVVRRIDTPEYAPITGRYIATMLVRSRPTLDCSAVPTTQPARSSPHIRGRTSPETKALTAMTATEDPRSHCD